MEEWLGKFWSNESEEKKGHPPKEVAKLDGPATPSALIDFIKTKEGEGYRHHHLKLHEQNEGEEEVRL